MISGCWPFAPLCPGSMATTLPDRPPPVTRRRVVPVGLAGSVAFVVAGGGGSGLDVGVSVVGVGVGTDVDVG